MSIQNNLSHHFKILRESGIIHVRKKVDNVLSHLDKQS